jgi:hypothetical protein
MTIMARTTSIPKRIVLSMLAGLLFGVAISEMTFYFLNTGETRPPQIVKLTIPQGTAQKVLLGESDPTLPASMYFVVGDTLLVNNMDSVVHQLGPLFIPSGSSASMKLDSELDYAFTCSFIPSKYIGLNVRPPLTLVTRILGILEAGLPMGFLIALYSIYAMPVKKNAI